MLALGQLACCLAAAPARAGGLPADGAERPLLFVAGAAAGSDAGDAVSARDGLDQAHRFFVEVPPQQAALVIDLFDADVLMGAGDAGEVDLARGGTGDTKARYELYDPAGRRAAVRFATGDDAGPAGADGAWIRFFDSRTAGAAADERFADAFAAASYGGDDGSRAFAGPWLESGDLGGAGAGTGDVLITGGELSISNRSDGEPWLNRPSVERELDLSPFAAATLSFDFATGPGVDFEDSLLVEASADGGASYHLLEEILGIVGATRGSRVYDLSHLISGSTRIRFRVGRFYAGPGESFRVDDLEIRAAREPGGSPPAGHWQLVVDMSSRLNGEVGADAADAGADENGDDTNGLGLRAHDGDPGAGGVELDVYAPSILPLGIRGRPGDRAAYSLYPWVISGCGAAVHDFDFDATPGDDRGSLVVASPGGARTPATALSADGAWNRTPAAVRPDPASATDYGVWKLEVSIQDPGPGNFASLRVGPDDGTAGGDYRLYLPRDDGGMPQKPRLTQSLGPAAAEPGAAGGRVYPVTVAIAHPESARGSLVFDAAHVVSATVPGGRVRYAGGAEVSHGEVLAEPAAGDGGELRWNPGVLAPGTGARLSYRIEVPGPAGADVTGSPGAGGTRAAYLDATGRPAVLGELCQLSVSPAAEPPPPPVLEIAPAAAEPPSTVPELTPGPAPEALAEPPPAPDPAGGPAAAPVEPPAAPAPAAVADYRVGPGDTLHVEVFEDSSLSGEFTVSAEGILIFPLLGEVEVRGLTTTELQEKLSELLEKDYLYDPHVSATITAYRSQRVQIQGMVRMPGIYYLEGPMRIFDLLSMAQGLLQAPGEIRAGQIARIVRSQTGETVTVDLHGLLVEGNDELNLPLSDGDVVYVLRTSEVHVIGEVKRPGSFPYEDGMTVLKALSLAGGPTKRGSVKGAVVKRIQDGEEIQVRVAVEDLLLPDDILEIPLSFW